MNYKFGNLLGAPYRGGDVVLRDSELLCPVGNRVQVMDLAQSTTRTLPFECTQQVQVMCMSPCGQLVLLFDEAGGCYLINKSRNAVLHRLKFGANKIRAAKFSPDGKYVAIGVGRKLEVWKRPGLEKVASPMEIHHTHYGCQADITTIDWSEDSFGIAVGAKDQTCRIFTLESLVDFKTPILAHRRALVGVSFMPKSMHKWCIESGMEESISLITAAKDGLVYAWGFERLEDSSLEDEKEMSLSPKSKKRKPSEDLNQSSGEEIESESEDEDLEEVLTSSDGDVSVPTLAYAGVPDVPKSGLRRKWIYSPGHWKLLTRHKFQDNYKQTLTAWDFHKESGLMVGAFSHGIFELVQMPGFERIQTLSVCQQRLTSVHFGRKGDWIAVGSAQLGQLLVWEWRSETYILKQQGHHFDVAAVAFSPDGASIATGAEDSKVKIYNLASGLCFATFNEHTMPVTAVQFMHSGHALCTASKDGTVRAYDLIRYRNFRTFTSPEPVQFVSLAVDPKGDVVVAGSQDTFQIFVWSIKTGRLLDMLAAHEGPVVGLSFSPNRPVLMSASWDKTMKVWDVFSSNKASIETLDHNHEVLALAYRPDGKQVAASTLEGNINFWDPQEGEHMGIIEGRRDMYRGRFHSDRRIATPFSVEAHFTTLVYGSDGAHILAGGMSKNICIYDVAEKVLLRRIQISHNRSYDGVLDRLNSRFMTDAGPMSLLDDYNSSDEDDGIVHSVAGAESVSGLPGTAQRGKKPIAQCRCISLSPSGRDFAVAATEGLLVFSLDDRLVFDPTDLTEEITPDAVERALLSGAVLKAILIALRLRDRDLIEKCLFSTPSSTIPIIAKSLPDACMAEIFTILGNAMGLSPHLEFLMLWVKSICTSHGITLSKPTPSILAALKLLQKSLSQVHTDLGAMCESNIHMLSYLSAAAASTCSSRATQAAVCDPTLVESDGEETDIVMD